MNQYFIPASFYRGGSSKGLFFHAKDLPAEIERQDEIFLAAMGSPDPNGRQLDGMGGGVSSLSKAVIIGPSTHPDADIDYTFAQVAVDKAVVDRGANCGNLSSAVGPFAIEEGLISATDGITSVRIHQVNTRKIIHAQVPVRHGKPLVEGELAIAGVSGSGARIRLDFKSPGGSITSGLLPTGNVVDQIVMDNGRKLSISMIDASNPVAFVAAEDLNLQGLRHPDEIETLPGLMATLDDIRRKAAVLMGLANTPETAGLANPKIAIASRPNAFVALDSSAFNKNDYDIGINMLSMERAHKAITLTGAMCAGVASLIEGTIPHAISSSTPNTAEIRVGNPSGIVGVSAKVDQVDGWSVDYASVFRTARCLMKGSVAVPARLADQ